MAAVGNLTDLIGLFTNIGLKLIPFLAVVALLAFLLGVGRFIKAAGNEKELKDSKNLLIWGVAGLFILVTIWGIVAFLQSEFGFGTRPGIPQVKIK